MNAQTLVQPVVERARQQPQQPALIFIHDDGQEETISAGQFHQEATAYAAALRQIGIRKGELVVLVLQHSRVLLSAFWGALYLGAVPSIFPFLTEKLDSAVYKERLHALITRAEVQAVITYPAFQEELQALLGKAGCQVLSTEDVPETAVSPSQTIAYPTNADQLAFLQHSSGTTGLQKGVALTHRAALNQIHAYSQAIALQPDDVVVSWLPLYHDMGLIAGFVMPIVTGVPLVLLSPFRWVRDPKSLLWAIHQHKGTLAWLPNFAYNHTVRSVRQRDLAGLDLSRWRMAINCSEPVRYDSHELFRQHFSAYGFRKNALATCYAMAENTFAVTQSPPQQSPDVDWVNRQKLQQGTAVPMPSDTDQVTPVVSCGIPITGTEVGIINETRQWLPQRQVGEIVIRSDCMLNGYYQQPEITQEAFWGDWYCTGDMGYLADGQLYVTGRKKDLIIVGGKNIYPQDVEAIANSVPGIYPGRIAAFGMQNQRLGTEEIVMVCELMADTNPTGIQEIERELRRRVVQELDVTLADVRLVEKRWLLKTSSGKVARSANRQKYLELFPGRLVDTQ
jgi:fatty-acyl-CoA synthase